MARSLARMIALAVVLVLAGSPAVAAVCDATCAAAARAALASGESTPGPHHHQASDVLEQAPSTGASDATAHSHHHHAAASVRPDAGSQLLSSTPRDNCRRDAEVGALPVAPRLDRGTDADQPAADGAPEWPAASAELPGTHLLRHGPSQAPAFLTAPLVLRI